MTSLTTKGDTSPSSAFPWVTGDTVTRGQGDVHAHCGACQCAGGAVDIQADGRMQAGVSALRVSVESGLSSS